MAIRFPQHDLPPDLLNSRISGATTTCGNEVEPILFGDFFESEATGVAGTASVSASAQGSATGSKAAVGTSAQESSAALSATGKKGSSGAASQAASAALAESGNKGVSGTGDVASGATVAAMGRKGIVSAALAAGHALLVATGAKTAFGQAAVGASVSSTASGISELLPDERTGTATVAAIAGVAASGNKAIVLLAMGSAFVAGHSEGARGARASGFVSADALIGSSGTKAAFGTSDIEAVAEAQAIGFFVRPILPNEISRSVISERRTLSATAETRAMAAVADAIQGASAATRQISARCDARAKGAHK